MADKLSPERRSVNMRAIKSKDTKPELEVRRLVHSMGFRYRLHRKDLPGRPDLVFAGRRKVIFVHGCFWHQHPATECLDGRRPKSNTSYWDLKLQRNVDRDIENRKALEGADWQTLVVWECELKDQNKLTAKIKAFLS